MHTSFSEEKHKPFETYRSQGGWQFAAQLCMPGLYKSYAGEALLVLGMEDKLFCGGYFIDSAESAPTYDGLVFSDIGA